MGNVKKYFNNISSKSWEHPADRAALKALKLLPGFDLLVKTIMSLTSERSMRLIFLGSSVKAGPTQFSRVYKLLEEGCSVLDIKSIPEIFVSQNPILNAGAYGSTKPFIVLNSALVDSLDDKELLAVIGHELGHIKSGHVVYKTMLYFLIKLLENSLQMLGLVNLITYAALTAIIAAWKEWDRKSELSADRAGMLVVQEEEPCYSLLMKMAGGNNIGELNINSFFEQAKEYEEGGDIIDSVHKFLNILGISHPFPVLRLKEIKTWVDSGEYTKILDGEYLYESEDREKPEDVFKEYENASNAYKEEFFNSNDPLAKNLHGIGKTLDETGKEMKKNVDKMGEEFSKTVKEIQKDAEKTLNSIFNFDLGKSDQNDDDKN